MVVDFPNVMLQGSPETAAEMAEAVWSTADGPLEGPCKFSQHNSFVHEWKDLPMHVRLF